MREKAPMRAKTPSDTIVVATCDMRMRAMGLAWAVISRTAPKEVPMEQLERAMFDFSDRIFQHAAGLPAPEMPQPTEEPKLFSNNG